MKKEPIRVLQITATMNMGGIENFLMNVYRNIDRNKIQFDFVINDGEKNYFEDEILNLGGRIFKVPSIKEKGHFKYNKALKKIFKSGEYKIVHSHYNTISGFILNQARKCKIENRIAHSHSSPGNKFKVKGIIGIYKKYSQKLIKKNATKKLACSNSAGKWLFNKDNFLVLNNGIIPEDYVFNLNIRNKIRENLLIKEDEILIGHIGRIDCAKNQSFAIEILKKLLDLNPNYKMFLVGDGLLKKELEEKVKKLNLENNVRFLGVRTDVKELLQAFDLFLFPSLFEGLPVTLIEAQATGLKCFVSNTITTEIDLKCNLIEFISLEKTAYDWAEIINTNKVYKRKNTLDFIKKNGYDMLKNINDIEKMYLELI